MSSLYWEKNGLPSYGASWVFSVEFDHRHLTLSLMKGSEERDCNERMDNSLFREILLS